MKRPARIPAAIFSIGVAASVLHGQTIPTERAIFPTETRLEPAITLHGIDGKMVQVAEAALLGLAHHTVNTTDHGTAVTFEGVLLADLLANVATPTGEQFRGTAASYYVEARGIDGYRAVFAWAELDPSFTDRKICLVMRRFGLRLPSKDGPFLIVVPDEKRQSRWVRNAVELWIKKTGGAGM